ncbi:hypothetical protein B296_00046155 [Ensete ventricosum]|uniref:Exocyst subunit Exo70 family protein n=1 Tax=Ensete ventricosum TaxID=4639 RepID=A0A426YKH5_ENSVE|nr:hypothetical protein B296_00046155 [Ensete ventricosum]
MRSLFSSSSTPKVGPQLHLRGPRYGAAGAPMSPSCFTFSDRLMVENIAAAAEVIREWGPEVDGSLFGSGRADSGRFLQAVSDLHRSMLFFSSPSADSGASTADRSAALLRAHSLLSDAICRLERELKLLLSAHGRLLNPLDSLRSASFSNSSDVDNPADSITEVESAADVAIRDLRAVADTMISAGYGKECFQVYKTMRKSAVDESIHRLGCERLTQAQVRKLDWAEFESKIRDWLAAVPIAFRTIFSGERLLCDRVFTSSDAIRESCFSDVARSTMADFEAAIHKDASRSRVPGGGVHPLTRYVMDYLVFLADYELPLADIFADFPFQAQSPLRESFDAALLATPSLSAPSSPSAASTTTSFESSPWSSSPSAASSTVGSISVRIAWLVLVLICKLDGKAELYREVALSYLFLANNLQYIVQKVKESGLRLLLGDEWVARHGAKARHYAASYERLAWEKVAAAIPEDGTVMAAMEAWEQMRGFNTALEAAGAKGLWRRLRGGDAVLARGREEPNLRAPRRFDRVRFLQRLRNRFIQRFDRARFRSWLEPVGIETALHYGIRCV